MKRILLFCIAALLLSSCLVQSPQYTSFEQVASLDVGLTQKQVEEQLGLSPYDVKAFTDSTNVLTYVYRTNERRTLSFHTEKKNGKPALGKYVQLFVTYSKKTGKVLNIESCSTCPNDLDHKIKIDYEKIYAFVTVTLPVILIYFGLKQGN